MVANSPPALANSTRAVLIPNNRPISAATFSAQCSPVFGLGNFSSHCVPSSSRDTQNLRRAPLFSISPRGMANGITEKYWVGSPELRRMLSIRL